MIKSINYQANQIASIEISDPEDIETLGDSYGYGSTARVTGQISAEYIYTPNGWISTSSSGGSGGGALVVNANIDPETGIATLDKTWQEIYNSMPIVMRVVFQGRIAHSLITTINELDGVYVVQCSSAGKIVTLETNSPNGYPSTQVN